jgi:hypothetical protein
MNWNPRFLPDDPDDFDLMDLDDESKHELRKFKGENPRRRRRDGHPYHKLRARESDRLKS